jgi:UDPglucose 6-dehydrogenase
VSRIAVIGSGYVGLTCGLCLAHLGHSVVCVDIDLEKVAVLQSGNLPIIEPGLEPMLASMLDQGRIRFTHQIEASVAEAEFIFLCVPTPESHTGHVDMAFVDATVHSIKNHIRSGAVVVNKSTVPVGSVDRVAGMLNRPDVSVVSNPEFLREGNAVSDFLNPSRIVVGGPDNAATQRVADLYCEIKTTMILCDAATAETIKYAANAFLATKISFINSIANVCEHVGADVRMVAEALGKDPRIGNQFLQPGPGFGGSCFPKDTLGLVRLAAEAGYEFDLLKSVIRANEEQFETTVDKVALSCDGSLEGKKIAAWGLTFKAHTDDRRCSPALEVIRRILERGAQVVAFDPTVAGTSIPELTEIRIAGSPVDACIGAETLIVLTEWPEFQNVSPLDVWGVMAQRRVVDARNLLNEIWWVGAGFVYRGIGF